MRLPIKTLSSYGVPLFSTGEIVVKGSHVIKQYLDNPGENRKNKIQCPRWRGMAPYR